MSNKKIKSMNNDIGKHCQSLIDDFFHFCDGELDKVKIIDELRDISDPMPPSVEQAGKMLARCNKAWNDYCGFMLLPRECKKLLINRVKKKWLSLEKQQTPKRKRRGLEKPFP